MRGPIVIGCFLVRARHWQDIEPTPRDRWYKQLQTKPRAGSKGSSSSDERQYDDADQDYVVRKNECWMGRYVIKNIIGKVCLDHTVKGLRFRPSAELSQAVLAVQATLPVKPSVRAWLAGLVWASC